MKTRELPLIGMLAAQFAAYHVDRCQAVARRLSGRARVLAVEVATTSELYAWEPSGEIEGAAKITLFPGQSHDSIGWFRRFRAQFRALSRCSHVLVGIGYHEPDVILLAWVLRLWGVKVILLTESKADDHQRHALREVVKSLLLSPFHAAIVGAARQAEYVRSLGFRRRTVLPGYNCVGLDRIRAQGGGGMAPDGAPHADRHFIFVGRFVPNKNLLELVEGFARYRALAGAGARRLILVGSGPLEQELRQRASQLGVAEFVDFPGFLRAEQVSAMLADSLALVLVSRLEPWGLVVNEALAFGLPAIVSIPVGARDVLVRNLVNGYVVEIGSIDGIARAMNLLAGDMELWKRMALASREMAWLGDTERLADAVELLLDALARPAAARVGEFKAATGNWN